MDEFQKHTVSSSFPQHQQEKYDEMQQRIAILEEMCHLLEVMPIQYTINHLEQVRREVMLQHKANLKEKQELEQENSSASLSSSSYSYSYSCCCNYY